MRGPAKCLKCKVASDVSICGPSGQPVLASDLPAVLGLPADLLPLLGARGVWHRPGHHADRRPCLLPGSLLGEQATVLQRHRRYGNVLSCLF